MSTRFSACHLSLVLPFLVAAAQAGTILDQSTVSNPSTYGGLNDSLEWQQQVTAGIGGMLAVIELFGDNNDTVTVSIGLGAGPFAGPFAFTTSASITQSGAFIDTLAANILLTPGEQFVIDTSGGSGHTNAGLFNASFPYAGGGLFRIGGENAFDDHMIFETFVLTKGGASTPEPTSLVLLSLGLGMISVLRLTKLTRKIPDSSAIIGQTL